MDYCSIDIVQGAPKTRNKHCVCRPLLNYFIHILLRYDIKENELSFYSFIINRNNTPIFYRLLGLIMYHIADCGRLLALCICLSVCLCVLAITAPYSNAESQPQCKVWFHVLVVSGLFAPNACLQAQYIFSNRHKSYSSFNL